MAEIQGLRKAGEESTEETPVASVVQVDRDPRLAEITHEITSHVRLTFNRGDYGATFDLPSEPTESEIAQYRKQAEETMDRLESQRTQEMQDRRK